MSDFIFQTVLFLAGALIGVIGQLLPNKQLKILAAVLGVLSICVALAWGAYALYELTFGLIPNELAESRGIIWDATFYGNKELKGSATLQGRIRGARNGLRVDWGTGAPRIGIPLDFFSAIFQTTHGFAAGTYCFVVEVDDGARLFVDGEEIRSVWWGYTPGAVYKTKRTLDEGPHTIQFYYYEEYENASFHLYWYKDAGAECVTVGHPGVP